VRLTGFIALCASFHRLEQPDSLTFLLPPPLQIAGPKDSTEPNAGLYTEARAGLLSQLIVDKIVENPDLDPDVKLFYNPRAWRNGSNIFFSKSQNWLRPTVKKTINRRLDEFSPRLGQECQPEGFPSEAPAGALFDTRKVAIVSNGRCASSCSLFSVIDLRSILVVPTSGSILTSPQITMKKLEGAKTVVVGGKSGVQQHYCGIVGGQSMNFKTVDSEVKTTGLKGHELAPPDLVVNGVQGITIRLGLGIERPDEPEGTSILSYADSRFTP